MGPKGWAPMTQRPHLKENPGIYWQRGSACQKNACIGSESSRGSSVSNTLEMLSCDWGIQFNKNVSAYVSNFVARKLKCPPPFVMLKIQVTHTIDGESSFRRQTLRHPSKNRYQKLADSREDRWSLLRRSSTPFTGFVVICNLVPVVLRTLVAFGNLSVK
jgi:hypothetical protein